MILRYQNRAVFRYATLDTDRCMTEKIPVMSGQELVRVLEKVGFVRKATKRKPFAPFS